MSSGVTVFSYNTTYDALKDTINHYYSSTANAGGWNTSDWFIVNQGNITPENAVSIMNNIPNYHVVANKDGSYRMFVNSSSYGTIPKSQATASAVNSNVQMGTNTAQQTMTVQAPAQTSLSQQGTIQATKGMGSTGQFITKSVVPAVFATGVGISLGKTIDSALYNANPDFWDAHGMSSLNPETWASLTADMSDTAGNTLLATAFNMIFGIDPNGKVQMYGDEQAVAYLALYMQRAGMFTEGYSYELPNDFPVEKIGNVTPIMTLPVLLGSDARYSYYIESYSALDRTTNTDATALMKIGANNVTGGIRVVGGLNISSGHQYQGNIVVKRYRNGSVDTTYNISMAIGSSTGDYPYAYGAQTFTLTPSGNVPISADQAQGDYNNDKALGLMLAYLNAVPMPSLDGTGTQTGATLPQLNDNMSIDDVLNALRQQYPDMFNNAITNDVVQPDGSTKTYTYVPIAYPQATSATDTHPTGDGQQSSQANPYYDPTSGVQSWDWVWDLIDGFDTSDWVEDDQYDDDGGDGSTPKPVMPTGSASALWKIYNPSQSQLDAFGSWLWSSDFVDQLKKLFNDPMQSIIGLHKVFVTPPVSGSGAIKVGYLTSSASANYVSGQYVDVDCGDVTLYEHFGNIFDYANTSLRLFLPFIGIVDLDVNDVMRGTVNVKYHVDVLTGACLAEVAIVRDNAGGILYTYSGNCAVQYPVSSGSYVGIVTGLLGIAGGVAGTIASGGALAPMLMGAGASVGHMHADVKHSGNISSNAGAMGVKKPYIIVERPQTKMPTNGVNIEGLPENQTYTLGSLHGYVKVKKAHYDGVPCTSAELEKIKALLENGVYIS